MNTGIQGRVIVGVIGWIELSNFKVQIRCMARAGLIAWSYIWFKQGLASDVILYSR